MFSSDNATNIAQFGIRLPTVQQVCSDTCDPIETVTPPCQ